MKYFSTKDLNVGYDGNILIHDINVEIEQGSILTLIGPNGAGKSTILKSITRHLEKISGCVYIEKDEIYSLSPKDMSKKISVMLTDRISPELMTCRDLVAMGRYPYTNSIGKLTPEDNVIVEESLRIVKALELADKQFTQLSDGQKQRILLARAICQDPDLMVLDEPTAYLDIRHKIDLLDILRKMSRENNITVIMSLHEIDLAYKVSDYLICVKGDTIAGFGTADELLKDNTVENLYDMKNGSYNLLLGSIELPKSKGDPKVFVISGGGYGIKHFRDLQKKEISFATGILYENDVDYQVAKDLSDNIILAPAFEPIKDNLIEKSKSILKKCDCLIDSGTPIGTLNYANRELFNFAKENKIPVYENVEDYCNCL